MAMLPLSRAMLEVGSGLEIGLRMFVRTALEAYSKGGDCHKARVLRPDL